MYNVNMIQINWDGPFTFEQARDRSDSETDYGLYQIYGFHRIYGPDVLLYIGKTDRTFAERMKEHSWVFNADYKNMKVYLGQFGGYEGQPSNEEWSRQINAAEQLLIYAHAPACNSQCINKPIGKEFYDIHVFNWGNRRALLPEVSGKCYSNYFNPNDIKFQPYKYDPSKP